ncbi:patatin-like phospholipase family protein [Roseivirga echinicomitans]
MKKIWLSFPVQLLMVHVKHNQFLLVYWFILFAAVGGSFGENLGIPYLFLDPVYLDEVSIWGFIIMGIAVAGFGMAFNITSYILDGFRFPFLGTLPKPLAHFCVNNSLIPFGFLVFYVIKIIEFQKVAGVGYSAEIYIRVVGVLLGCIAFLIFLFAYFFKTNRDIFKVLGINQQLKITRTNSQKLKAFRKLQSLKRSRVKVDYYMGLNLKFYSTKRFEEYYDRMAILRVFLQNQRNAIIIESLVLLIIFGLGLFQDVAIFQIPAAASGTLLLTMIVMLTGALSFWFRSWIISGVLGVFILLNMAFTTNFLTYQYPAYGLNYESTPAEYKLENLKAFASEKNVEASKEYMLEVLENWKAKFTEEKPKMVLIAVSGGGQRSALWTTNVLQKADSVFDGDLMNSTFMITGASGGLFGAAFYRELAWKDLAPQAHEHLADISKDVLNPVIFTLLVNDLFVKFRSFEYGGFKYKKERGYEFEQRLKANLHGLLDNPISTYRAPEFNAEIPLLIVGSTITNDGRKLYISPHPTAFFNTGADRDHSKVQGVDFNLLLAQHQPDSLRFLTALRMSATFPYFSPSITLPTKPRMSIADAGISDNYGISDATTFLHVFEDWIKENTSEVVLITIRDSSKEPPIEADYSKNLVQKFISPIQGAVKSWDQIQTIKNEQRYDMISSGYGNHLRRIEFEYQNQKSNRASLSWRLTDREILNILDGIKDDINQKALKELEK